MSITLPGLKITSNTYNYDFGTSSIAADRKISLPLLTADDTFVCENHPQTITNKTMGDDLVMGGNKITGLGAPTNSGDAVTKSYTDSVAAGLAIKVPCRVATTVNITTYTNNAGSPKAVGQFTSAPDVVDGVTLVNGDRILVNNQSDKKENGIYVATATTTTWNRASNYDEASEVNDGDFIMVQEGTVNKDIGYVQINTVSTVGTASGSNIDFIEFYTLRDLVGGDGIVKTGNSIATDITSNSGIKITSGKLDTDLLSNGGLVYNSGLRVDLSGTSIAGSVTETKGGTGQTAYATGDILYSSGVNTLSKLTAGTDGNVLTLATGTPSWAAPAVPTLENVLISGNTAGSTSINLQGNNLLSTGTLFSNTGTIKIGSGTTSGSSGVSIGQSATSGTNSVAIGVSAATISTNSSIAIGYTSNSGNYSVSVGHGTNTLNGSNSVAIGTLASADFANSMALGNRAVVAAANECVIGDGSLTHIRSLTANTCDIGSATYPYRDVNLQRDLKFSINGDIKNLNGINTTNGSLVSIGGRLKVKSLKYTEAEVSNRYFVQTADKIVSSTTSETDVIGTGIGSTTIPANTLIVGDSFNLKIKGYATKTTGSLTLRVKFNNVNFITVAVNNTFTSKYWEADISFTIRAVGGSGSFSFAGNTMWDGVSAGMPLVGTTAADTTSSLTIRLTAQPSSATTTVASQLCEFTNTI